MRASTRGSTPLIGALGIVLAACAGGVSTSGESGSNDGGAAGSDATSTRPEGGMDAFAGSDGQVDGNPGLDAADDGALESGDDGSGGSSGSGSGSSSGAVDSGPDAAACTGSATRCAGNTPQTCDATGNWQSGAACPYTCTGGACAGQCAPTSTESCAICGTTGTATCDGTYTWGTCQPPSGICSYVDQGCNVSCDTVGSCWPHVDRSYSSLSGFHLYTTSDTEASCCGYSVEYLDYYYLYATQNGGLAPFYRCLLANNSHLYTTDSTCEGAAGATNEGSLGFIATSPVCGSTALYRLYNGTSGDHFYTISSSEAASAEASNGYVSEGVAGYVWTAPE